MTQPLFELGQTVATPAALEALDRNGQAAEEFLFEHCYGYWGDLSADDRTANEDALADGGRIFSKYLLKDGEAIWVITEAVGEDGKRASTCVLLPDDY